MVINYSTDPEFIPFSHWQNARFVINVVDSNTQTVPNWLQIDQINQSLRFNLSLIDSVGDYSLSLNARLITFSTKSNDVSKYTTDSFSTTFDFINKNCQFINSNATYFLVFEQISTFILNFADDEHDKIIISTSLNEHISYYIQNTNDSNIFKILWKSNEVLSNPVQLNIEYTDSYHQDLKYIEKIILEFYLFEVEPPSFTSVLPVISANRCHNLTVSLPEVIDPNGLNWSFSLDRNTPDWITLTLNNSLFLNTTNLSYNISEVTIVSLKVMNEKNAWRMYNLTINTDQYYYPSFTFIDNITVIFNTTSEVKLDLDSKLEIRVVDWVSNLEISWIKFTQNSSTLHIYPSSIYVPNQCVKLEALDSCNNQVYSNQFYIFIKHDIDPPYVGNIFGPLYVYSGILKLFTIPKDLFVSKSDLEYFVSVISWSIDSKLFVNVTMHEQDKTFYLYVLSGDAKTCLISISVMDSERQSAETTVKIIALNWASKDWLEWTSQYQTDWIKCKENYRLGSYGVWYLNTIFFPSSFSTLFDVWGLIVMISLSISLILFTCIGKWSLYAIEFAHTIIIFIISSSNQDLKELVSWIQNFKLDFGFLDQLHIREYLFWNIGSDEMTEIQFYWQSTLLNYFYLILIILVLIGLLFLTNKILINIKLIAKIYNHIGTKLNRHRIAWMLIYIFSPFLIINLLSDALNASNHIISSLTSFVGISVAIIFLMIKYQEIFTVAFLRWVDENDSSILTFITILKSICHAFLYLFRSSSIRRILLLIEYALHFPFIFVSFIGIKEQTLFSLYSSKMRGVKSRQNI